MTSSSVRVGFIGAGFARRVQLPGLALVPGAKATAIASAHRANAEAVAREFGLAHVFADGADLARSPEVDLVVFSSTPDSHARFSIAALEAGKHVLCEKPMAIDAFEAAQMLEGAAARPDRPAPVDHQLRYEPNPRGRAPFGASPTPGAAPPPPHRRAWTDHELRSEPNRRRVRELIRANAIGELRHIELSLKPYLRGDGRPQAFDAPWTWWSDAARGGGLLGAAGSHLIDLG